MKIATLLRVGRGIPAGGRLGLLTIAALLLGAVGLKAQSSQTATTVTTLGGGPQYYNPASNYGSSNSIYGTLYSQFHTPSGIAVDSGLDLLYVADRDNNAVRYLDLISGQTYTLAPYPPYIPTNLISKPVGVAVDAVGNVYVLNRGNGKNGTVVEIDFYGDYITSMTGLTNASGITLDTAGNIYVTASNTVFRITSPGVSNVVTTIPNAGASLQGIVMKRSGANTGWLAVCDSGRNGIYLINPTNGIVTTNAGFNGMGDGTGLNNRGIANSQARFFQPSGLAEAGDGSLIVADMGNNRVKVVGISGYTTNLYGVASNLWWSGTTGSGGTAWIGWSDGPVWQPDTVGDVQARLPFGVAVGSDGTVYTTEDYYHIVREVTGANIAPPPPPPPSQPVITAVTTNYGQVNLSWAPVTGATGYNVKRSPSSGGTYTTLASIASTTYTDTNVINGTTYYYVVSAFNAGGESTNSAEVSATPPLPPVPDPQIGYVTFPPPDFTSVFTPGTPAGQTFNNDVPIVIIGTDVSQTFYTYGNTTVFTNLPDPTPASSSAPQGYHDGLSSIAGLTVAQVLPNLAIKAVGHQSGHPDSATVSALFQFVVANPNLYGNNAAQFSVSNITVGAKMYYTTDGSTPDPTNPAAIGPISSGQTLSLNFGASSNLLLMVRGFKDSYQPSGIVSNLFSKADFVANSISFGSAYGEPSSKFIARPGQFYYAPVTLNLLPNFTKMYSLQFNVAVTNGLASPPIYNGAGIDFFSMLMSKVKPDEGLYFPPADGNWYLPIPGLIPVLNGTATNWAPSAFVNTNNNLLGVGWLYRTGIKYLATDTNGQVFLDFDTSAQDLTAFSIAHDTLFTEGNGKVVVGAYSFQVPKTANVGDKYFIQIGNPSATSDGVGAPGASIYIQPPATNQVVTVGSPVYLVGDVAPFHWFNAGDFGNSNLDNSDVMQVYQAAILGVNMPPANSDLYAAMDSSGMFGVLDADPADPLYNTYTNISSALTPTEQTALFDGNDQTINTNIFGDGVLDVSDLYVTFRRSLDPSLTWYNRFWIQNQIVGVPTPNLAYNTNIPSAYLAKSTVQPSVKTGASQQPFVTFTAGDAQASAGQVVQIPITANIVGNYPLCVLGLNLTVYPLDGSPALTQPVQFTPAPGLGAPTPGFTTVKGDSTYAAAWLNNSITGLTGNATIGTLTVTLPANATSLSAYAVHFNVASGSPNGLGVFSKRTLTGLITTSSRTNSTYNDGIPDSWRLRWFGTIYNLLSVSNACPSGDGVNNWQKYVAGVDPNTPNDFPNVNAKSSVPPGATAAIHWPTISGKQYVVLRSDSLFSGSWTPVSTNTGTGTDMEYDDYSTGTAKFYRVLILP